MRNKINLAAELDQPGDDEKQQNYRNSPHRSHQHAGSEVGTKCPPDECEQNAAKHQLGGSPDAEIETVEFGSQETQHQPGIRFSQAADALL